jgi:hypothetical protein
MEPTSEQLEALLRADAAAVLDDDVDRDAAVYAAARHLPVIAAYLGSLPQSG